MRGVISVCLFFLGAITSLIGQVSVPAVTFLKLLLYSCIDGLRITLTEKITSNSFYLLSLWLLCRNQSTVEEQH